METCHTFLDVSHLTVLTIEGTRVTVLTEETCVTLPWGETGLILRSRLETDYEEER